MRKNQPNRPCGPPGWEKKGGGRNWIRTNEGVSQQIYSLPPLATWVSYRPAAQAPRGAHIKPHLRVLVNGSSLE